MVRTTARDRPVTPRKILDAQEVDLGAPDPVELPSTGPLPPRDNMIEPQTDHLKFKDLAAALAFNEEKIVIRISETTDPNADQKVFVGINGRGVWLDRGVEYRISRKYAERLAREGHEFQAGWPQIDEVQAAAPAPVRPAGTP